MPGRSDHMKSYLLVVMLQTKTIDNINEENSYHIRTYIFDAYLVCSRLLFILD